MTSYPVAYPITRANAYAPGNALLGSAQQPPPGQQFLTVTDNNGAEQFVTVTDNNGVEQRITVATGS